MTLSSLSSRPIFKSMFAAAIAVGTISGALIAPAGPALAASDYVLTCNPGRAMEVVAGQRVSSREAFATLQFNPGRQGAAFRAPRAGECTWTDRGFRRGEPTKLIYRDNGKWVQSVCRAGSCDTRTNSRGIKTLMDSVKRGRPFVVRAHNDRNGHMVITHFGP